MIATVKNSTTVMPRTPRRDSTCEAPLRGKRGGSRVGAPLGLQRKHPCCGEQGVCRRKVQRGLVRPARLPNGTAGRAPQQVAAGWPCQQGGLGPRAPDRQGPSTTLTGSVSPLLRGRFHHRRCSPRSDCTIVATDASPIPASTDAAALLRWGRPLPVRVHPGFVADRPCATE